MARDEDGAGGGLLDARQSRRAFLKSIGVAGAVVAMPGAALRAGDENAGKTTGEAGVEGLRELGEGSFTIAVTINGEQQHIGVSARTTLLEMLRDHKGLTGSKEVCSRGSCGACSVLLDGVAVNACMIPASDVDGRSVTTIEGIAADPAHAGLIDSFCTHDGAQCGFCIPGFVVRSAALLSETPSPTMEEIKSGLAGNLCRCGTYPKIFESVAAAAKGGAK